MAIGERLKEKAAEIRRKGGRDVSRGRDAAQRKARERAEDAKQKAKQDVKAAERAASKTSVKKALKKIATEVDAGDISDAEAEDLMDRARRAGEARAPVDAELNPGHNHRKFEEYAAGGDTDSPSETGLEEMASVGMDMDSGFFGDDSESPGFFGGATDDDRGDREDDGDDNPLHFDDGFGLMGGSDE